MPKPQGQLDDLQAGENLKRIDDLEVFRKGFEGKEFDNKVAQAIKDSKSIDIEIERVVWNVLKSKVHWFILSALLLVFFDALKAWAISALAHVIAK